MKSDSPREKSNFAIEEGGLLEKVEETINDNHNTKNTIDANYENQKNQTYIADERNNEEPIPAAATTRSELKFRKKSIFAGQKTHIFTFSKVQKHIF